MRTGPTVAAFAHLSGWQRNTPEVASGYGPATRLYLPVTAGVPIIIDGYVVSGGTDQASFEYAGLDWATAPCRQTLGLST